jgi:HK97 family phage portal protein
MLVFHTSEIPRIHRVRCGGGFPLAFWNNWLSTTKAPETEIGTTIPLNTDAGNASTPDVSFANLAREGYAKSEIVNACIQKIAVGAASARYFVEAPVTDGGTVEIDRGPLAELLQRPNQTSDWYSFIEQFVTFLHTSGNVYTYKVRGRGRQIVELLLLRPERIKIVPGPYGAEGYLYEIDGVERRIEPEDICHMSLPNPSGDLYGLSPLQTLAKAVNLDSNMTDFSKNFFQNAGVPSGLLKVKRRINSPEEAALIRSRWRWQFGGKNNMHRIAVMDEDADYVAMASAPKDMAMRDLHDLTESRICAVFGVPAILVGANVGLQRSTYSNYKEARMAFHSEKLEPMVNKILSHLNYNVASEYNGPEQIQVDWAAMRASLDDRSSEATRITGMWSEGILTLNETRTMLGFDSMDGGDVRRLNASTFEIGVGDSEPVAVGGGVEDAIAIEEMKVAMALKAPRIASGAGRLRRQMLEDRETETDKLAPKIKGYFNGLRQRVDGILGRYMQRDIEAKDLPIEADGLIPEGEANRLAGILREAMVDVSRRTFSAINENGLAGTLEWSERLRSVNQLLTSAPTRAQMIHGTTDQVIRRAVSEALRNGYSIEQLANGVPDDNFQGLRRILSETETRARLIARTEIMRSQNATSVGFYEEQGFGYVRADDIDGDPNDTHRAAADGRTCAERHRQIYRLEDAMQVEDHPNGTLNWEPMPRNYVPEEPI